MSLVLDTRFLVDGQPLYAPDGDMEHSFEDLDAADTGRDESGVMHRIVVRHKVGSWSFTYSFVSDAELRYLLGLFAGKSTFAFTHPDALNPAAAVTTTAYMSKYGIAWHDARRGCWRNLKFNIIEC